MTADMPPNPRRVSARRRVAFGALVALVVVAALEVVARGWVYWSQPWHGEVIADDDPELVYRLRPLQRGDTPTNSLGLRGPEPDLSRQKRVLVLGDSVAFGVQLEDAETFPRQLERLLGSTATVLNAGVVGYNTWQERRLFQRLQPRLRPTHVILQFCANDRYALHHETTLRESAHARIHPLFIGSPLQERLFRWSGLAHALFTWKSRSAAERVMDQIRAQPPPPPWQSAWSAVFEDLLRLVVADGVQGLLLLIPTEDQLGSQDISESDAEAAAMARAAEVPVLDMLGRFRAAAAEGLQLYHPGDPVHLSRAGARIVAEELRRSIDARPLDA